jgi:hypothetical protein
MTNAKKISKTSLVHFNVILSDISHLQAKIVTITSKIHQLRTLQGYFTSFDLIIFIQIERLT